MVNSANIYKQEPSSELYCIVFEYLYSAPQQPQAHRGTFGYITPIFKGQYRIIQSSLVA